MKINHDGHGLELQGCFPRHPPRDRCPGAEILWISILCLCLGAGHPEFSEQTVRSIVEASVPSGRMGPREQELIRVSYDRLDPQKDYTLLQRICSSHIRK